jgi:uncharacterized protein YceK
MIEMKQNRSLVLLLVSLLLVGCASLSSRRIPVSFERPEQCQAFFDRLDEWVRRAGVRDASSVSIPGFPYLRTNRFLAALKRTLQDDREKEAWVRWMQELDLKSRKKEISNLPQTMLLPILSKKAEQTEREEILSRVNSCSSELLNHDQTRPDLYVTLEPLVDVPDEYSWLMRTLGLYPLIALPVAAATNSSRKKIRSWFDTNLDHLPADGRLRPFVPNAAISLPENEVQRIVEEAKRNPLGVPLLNEKMEKKLVASFAPVFIQDVAGPYDQLGEVVWKDDRIEVNPEKPVVYYYLSHAFLKGEPILQIDYVIWYSERAGERPPWIELGHLDGLTIRVSLDHQGKAFMVDVVMDCGCYHLFAPQEERVDRILPRPFMFDAFVPQWFPVLSPGERLGIRITSGWHQVQRLISVGEVLDPIPYELFPYGVLEALPHEDGRTESIFDTRGIAKGSERTERFLLFSMGVPSVGSMRQRGHHAIELIGRVHFDDPLLFDQNFVFK